MKKINTILLALTMLFSFVACQDDEGNHLKLDESSFVNPTWEVNVIENIVVTQANLKDEVGTWKWTKADFGIVSPITYIVVIDHQESLATANEVARYTIVNVEEKITNQMINSAVQSFLPEGAGAGDMEETTFYIGVKAVLGSAGTLSPLFADTKKLVFTPIPLTKTKPATYLVGDALHDWDNSTGGIGKGLQVLFADDSDNGNLTYTYTAFFTAGEKKGLKFPTIAGEWDTAYGFSPGSSNAEGSLVVNGGDMPAPAVDGVYTLTLDLINLSVSLLPYEGSLDKYDAVGIVGGAANGWDSDVEMTKIGEHVWVARDVQLSAGEIKFRANKAWAKSWGVEKTGVEFPFGKATGGENIQIEVSNKYYVALNTLTTHYIIIPMEDLLVKK